MFDHVAVDARAEFADILRDDRVVGQILHRLDDVRHPLPLVSSPFPCLLSSKLVSTKSSTPLPPLARKSTTRMHSSRWSCFKANMLVFDTVRKQFQSKLCSHQSQSSGCGDPEMEWDFGLGLLLPGPFLKVSPWHEPARTLWEMDFRAIEEAGRQLSHRSSEDGSGAADASAAIKPGEFVRERWVIDQGCGAATQGSTTHAHASPCPRDVALLPLVHPQPAESERDPSLSQRSDQQVVTSATALYTPTPTLIPTSHPRV